MNEARYRKRTANFSTKETRILLDLVRKYKHIIECKQSDKILWNKKNQVWVEIAGLFNSLSGTIYRDAGVLKKKYENLKKVTKRKFAAQRCALQGSDRGCNVSSITKIDEEVKTLLEMQEDDNDCNNEQGTCIMNIDEDVDRKDDWNKHDIGLFIKSDNLVDIKDENESSFLPNSMSDTKDDIDCKESCVPYNLSQYMEQLQTVKIKTEPQDSIDEEEGLSSFLQEPKIKVEEDEHIEDAIPEEHCSENYASEDSSNISTDIYKCNKCNLTFSLKANLTKHFVVHTDEKLYSCNVCGKYLKNKNSLDLHLRRHVRRHKYFCECGKSFDTKNNLDAHSRVHTGERPYTCEFCNKCFVQQGGLDNHVVKVHHQVYGYSCEVCKKSYKLKSNLDSHSCIMVSHHCGVCSRTFNRKDTLENHLRTHTGERPFSCDLCKKSFTVKHGLMRHVKGHE